MVYDNLISIVEHNYESLSRMWAEDIMKTKHMSTYRTLTKEELEKRGRAVFVNLIKWLKEGAKNDLAEKYFEGIGRYRFVEGFPLAEINYALYLAKKVFWCYVAWKDEIFGSMEKAKIVEFTTLLNNYFDLGYFYLARGYFNKVFEKIDDSVSLSKSEIKSLLRKGEVNQDELEKEEIIWRHI